MYGRLPLWPQIRPLRVAIVERSSCSRRESREFYAEKGFTNEPGRCASCRAAYKARRNAAGGGSSYSSPEPGSFSSGYDRPQRQMYPAVCSSCGKDTQVPFEPRLDKPVYCSNCFTPRERTGSSGGGGAAVADAPVVADAVVTIRRLTTIAIAAADAGADTRSPRTPFSPS